MKCGFLLKKTFSIATDPVGTRGTKKQAFRID